MAQPARRAPLPALLILLLAGAGSAAAADYLRLEGHGGPVTGAVALPDGRGILTASFDTSLGSWDSGTGELMRWLEGHDAAVNVVAPAGEGRAVSGGDDFAVILWDLDSGEPLRRFEGHRGKVLAVAAAPEAGLAASASVDGTVRLWELASGAAAGALSGGAPVNDLAFLAGGRELLSADRDGVVRRWDVAQRALVRVERRNGFSVNRILVDEAAGWMLFGANNGAVRAVALDGGADLVDLTLDDAPVLALARSPDGARVAVGDAAGYVHVVSTEDWSTERGFRAVRDGPIFALAFTSDGERLVAGTMGDHVDVWPVAGPSGPPAEAGLRRPRPSLAEMSNGERQFARRCAICHTLRPDGRRRAGPTLHGVFGRRVGGLEGYSYSESLANRDFLWSAETIDQLFDVGPDKYLPGTKMPVQRIANARDRLDLVGFLRQATAVDDEGD